MKAWSKRSGPQAVLRRAHGPPPRSQPARTKATDNTLILLCLCSINLITSDLNSDRPLDALHRDDQALIAIQRHQNPLNSVQAASTNSNFLSNTEKRVGFQRNLASENRLYRLNLIVRNGDAQAAGAHKTKYS